jgi:hypothetical protein
MQEVHEAICVASSFQSITCLIVRAGNHRVDDERIVLRRQATKR